MATITVTSFTPGTTISSTAVNANFTTVVDAINGGIDTVNLTNGAVTENKLGDLSVATGKIQALAVSDAKVATGISAGKIGAGTVDNTEFGYLNGVTSAIQTQLDAKLESVPAGGVDTAELADGAVTNAKLGTGAVDTAELADGAVTTAKLDADAVNGSKIANDSIDSEHYVDGSVDPAHTSFFNQDSDAIIYFGRVNNNATGVKLPAGWSSASSATGRFNVDHSFGDTGYVFIGTADFGPYNVTAELRSDDVLVSVTNDSGTLVNVGFSFIVIRY